MKTYSPDLSLESIQHNPYKDMVAGLPVDASRDWPEVRALNQLRGEEAKQAQLACLYYDRVDVLCTMNHGFEWAMAWMLENFDYVLQHSSKLFHGLAGNVFLHPQIVANTGRFVDKLNLGDDDRLSILAGETHSKVPALGPWMRTCLVADPSLYLWLSPGWIGSDDCVLRGKAISLGWNKSLLAPMCRMHVNEKTKSPWVGALAFPYSLALLDLHSTGPQEVELGSKGWDDASKAWPIKMNKHANACDAVVAQALLNHLAWPRSIGLVMPASVQKAHQGMPVEDRVALVGVVQAYVGLGMLDEFTEFLVQQETGPGLVERVVAGGRRGSNDALELPALDGGPA